MRVLKTILSKLKALTYVPYFGFIAFIIYMIIKAVSCWILGVCIVF